MSKTVCTRMAAASLAAGLAVAMIPGAGAQATATCPDLVIPRTIKLRPSQQVVVQVVIVRAGDYHVRALGMDCSRVSERLQGFLDAGRLRGSWEVDQVNRNKFLFQRGNSDMFSIRANQYF